MINIFLLTVLALVVIAVFAVTCHKQPEKVKSCTPEEAYWRYEFGTGAEIEYTHDEYGNPIRLTGASICERERILADYGVPAEFFNDQSKTEYEGLNEKRKELIDELVPLDLRKAFDSACANHDAQRAHMSIMLNHLTNDFYHKP